MRRTPRPIRESELLLLNFDSFSQGADDVTRFTQRDIRTLKTKTKAKSNNQIQPWSVPVYSEPGPVMSPSLVHLTPRGCQDYVLYPWLLLGEEKNPNVKKTSRIGPEVNSCIRSKDTRRDVRRILPRRGTCCPLCTPRVWCDPRPFFAPLRAHLHMGLLLRSQLERLFLGFGSPVGFPSPLCSDCILLGLCRFF